jgi:uncharacterized protein (TIGR01244 family)
MLQRFCCLMIVSCLPVAASAQLMNRAEPLPGITSSGQPDEAALTELAEEGYKVVIDLRGASENRGLDEAAVVEDLGMKYVSLPISGADAVNYENAEALAAILAEADGPVLVHCASGNRVGAMLSLRERLLGAEADAALATGLEAGLSSPALKASVESLLQER